jgi:AhpD family alkylhydroperoxidase
MSEQVDPSNAKNETAARSQASAKAKRTLFTSDIVRRFADVVASGPVLLKGAIRPKISAALREKLFLAVSAINDCRLCKWGHTHWAMARGVPLDEVNQILGLQTESLAASNPSEAAVILFAQHYAEQLGEIDPQSIENLRKYYSEPEVAEILAYVRFMMLTNLTGNTLDSIWTRVHYLRKKSSREKPTITSAASLNTDTRQVTSGESR